MHFPFKAPFLNEETNLSKSYTLEGEYIFIFWWTIPLSRGRPIIGLADYRRRY